LKEGFQGLALDKIDPGKVLVQLKCNPKDFTNSKGAQEAMHKKGECIKSLKKEPLNYREAATPLLSATAVNRKKQGMSRPEMFICPQGTDRHESAMEK